MSQQKQNGTFMPSLAIMSIFLISMGIGTITPAIQSIADAFPNIPYTTILYASTLPTLLVVPSTLITGALAGKKVKYKTLSLIGILLFVISGVAPAFINNNFNLILVSRAIFGIGLGIITPLGNALVFELYEGQKRANLLGTGTVVMNLGGVILQMLGGTLAGINWSYCFYAHALGILSFIVILFFLPEPDKSVESVQIDSEPAKKEKLSMGVWIVCILFGIINMLNFPTMMNMSTIVMNRGIGDATTSATILSLFTIGGMVGGTIFGKIYQVAKRFVISIALITMSAGVGLIIIGNNVGLMIAGATLLGAGFSICMPSIFMIIGMMTTKNTSTLATSVAMALMNLGGFISTYWIGAIIGITGDGVIMPIKIELVLFAISAVIFFVVNPFPKAKASDESVQ